MKTEPADQRSADAVIRRILPPLVDLGAVMATRKWNGTAAFFGRQPTSNSDGDSERGHSTILITDANSLFDLVKKNLPVADLAGSRVLDDSVHN